MSVFYTFSPATVAKSSEINTNFSGLDTRLVTVEGAYIKKDGTVAFTADQSMGSKKIINLASGVNAGDAVNMSQLSDVAYPSTAYFQAQNTNIQTIYEGAWRKLAIDALGFDPSAGFQAVNNRWVVPVTGWYLVTLRASLAYDGSNGIDSGYLSMWVNNVESATIELLSATIGTTPTTVLPGILVQPVYLTAGQYIEGWIYANISSGGTWCQAFAGRSILTAHYLHA